MNWNDEDEVRAEVERLKREEDMEAYLEWCAETNSDPDDDDTEDEYDEVRSEYEDSLGYRGLSQRDFYSGS